MVEFAKEFLTIRGMTSRGGHLQDELQKSRYQIFNYIERVPPNVPAKCIGVADLFMGPHRWLNTKFFQLLNPPPVLTASVTSYLQSSANSDKELANLLLLIANKEASDQEMSRFSQYVKNAQDTIAANQPKVQIVFEISLQNNSTRFYVPSEAILELVKEENEFHILLSTLLLSPPINPTIFQPITFEIRTKTRDLWESLVSNVYPHSIVSNAMDKRQGLLQRASETPLLAWLEKQSAQFAKVVEKEVNENLPNISPSNVGRKKSSSKPASLATTSHVPSNSIQLDTKPVINSKSRQSKPVRSRKGRIADPTKNCFQCGTSHTALWRKAMISGESVTMCNSCGIKFATKAKKEAPKDQFHNLSSNEAQYHNEELPPCNSAKASIPDVEEGTTNKRDIIIKESIPPTLDTT